jgi:DNA-binding transcriptional regulator PaaX
LDFIVALYFTRVYICNHKVQLPARTTIIGILVLADRALSTAQLIRLAEPLGLSPSNLKSHLTRMVCEGSLKRAGPIRQATYSPSAAQEQVITSINARLTEDPKGPWDNTWYMLTLRLPANRAERDRLRASLWFDGFRPVSFDCFVRPAWPQPWAESRIRTYVAGGAFCIRGEIISRLRRMENLYDLRGLDSQARGLAAWLKRQRGASVTPRAAFVARMEAGGHVARLIGHDPRLPPAIWGNRRGMAEVIREHRRFEKLVSNPAQRFIRIPANDGTVKSLEV